MYAALYRHPTPCSWAQSGVLKLLQISLKCSARSNFSPDACKVQNGLMHQVKILVIPAKAAVSQFVIPAKPCVEGCEPGSSNGL